jgi:hypothetical protein
MSIQDSVQAALDEQGAKGATLDDIWGRANELSLRQCSKLTISQALQTVGGVFEQSTGLWKSDAMAIAADSNEDGLV